MADMFSAQAGIVPRLSLYLILLPQRCPAISHNRGILAGGDERARGYFAIEPGGRAFPPKGDGFSLWRRCCVVLLLLLSLFQGKPGTGRVLFLLRRVNGCVCDVVGMFLHRRMAI